jgi:class 3 adenylate cyclase
MEASLNLELKELISNSMAANQIEEIGKDLDANFNPSKLANLPLGGRLRDRNLASKLIVDYFADAKILDKLVVRFIESEGKKVGGQVVAINGLDTFLSKLTHFGLVYNREKGRLEEFKGKTVDLDNWGILKEGETYELAFISIDIAGNSILQSKYSKEEIDLVYKRFLDYLEDVLTKYRGKVWNWAGDGGLLAFYLDNKAQEAVNSAVSVLLGMVVFNSCENILKDPINLRIAVDRGNATYKSDKGSIFSETINWVCHLEKKGTDVNSISISQGVFESLDAWMKQFFFKHEEFENKIAYRFSLDDFYGSKKKKGLFGK